MNELNPETLKFLIKKKINSVPKKQARNILLDCINKNYNIPDIILDALDTPEKNDLLCQICNGDDFLRQKHEEVCQNCGLTRPFEQQLKTFEKSVELIEPRQNIVTIERDGKDVKVDLNKINQWLQDSDPLAEDYTKIEETLNRIFISKGRDLPKNVLNTSLELYIYFNKLKHKMPKKESYNKLAILALCIYYGLNINSEEITIEEISLLLNINTPEIYANNGILKIIYKDTPYLKYFTLTDKKKCDIDIPLKVKNLINIVQSQLIKFGYTDFKILDNKKYLAIIYFIKNNIQNDKTFTLTKIVEECNSQDITISTQTISKVKKQIETFYINNPKLFNQLK